MAPRDIMPMIMSTFQHCDEHQIQAHLCIHCTVTYMFMGVTELDYLLPYSITVFHSNVNINRGGFIPQFDVQSCTFHYIWQGKLWEDCFPSWIFM